MLTTSPTFPRWFTTLSFIFNILLIYHNIRKSQGLIALFFLFFYLFPIARQPSNRADWHGSCCTRRAKSMIERPGGRCFFSLAWKLLGLKTLFPHALGIHISHQPIQAPQVNCNNTRKQYKCYHYNFIWVERIIPRITDIIIILLYNSIPKQGTESR